MFVTEPCLTFDDKRFYFDSNNALRQALSIPEDQPINDETVSKALRDLVYASLSMVATKVEDY